MNGSHLLCVTRRFLYWLVRHSQSERVFVTEFIEQHLCLYSTSKSNSGSFLKHRFYVDRLIFEFLFRHKIKRSHLETMTSNSTRHLMCKKVLPMNTTTQMKKEKKTQKPNMIESMMCETAAIRRISLSSYCLIFRFYIYLQFAMKWNGMCINII